MNWNDKEAIRKLADVSPDAAVTVAGLIRYTAECTIRERERLAAIFESEADPEKIAAAIRDTSKDAGIFVFTRPPN